MEMSIQNAASVQASPATVLRLPEGQDHRLLVMTAKPSPEVLAKVLAPTIETEGHVLRVEATGLMQRVLDPDPKGVKDPQERHKPMDHNMHQEQILFTMRTISPEKTPTWARTTA